MDKEQAVRLAFYFALKYHPQTSQHRLHDKVWRREKLKDIDTIPGDVFAHICQKAGVWEEDYFVMADKFFIRSKIS